MKDVTDQTRKTSSAAEKLKMALKCNIAGRNSVSSAADTFWHWKATGLLEKPWAVD